MISKRTALAALALIAATAPAHAAVVISTAATQNMDCSGGTCEPTATDATLNVGDLENMLASGNMQVTTTGSSGVQASDIRLATALAWSSGTTLSLDAYLSIKIDKPLSVKSGGGLSFATSDGGFGGVLVFGTKGRAVFAELSSLLSINGMTYTLVNSVKSLSMAVATNPSGAFALARDYNAGNDGTYTSSPIAYFTGNFEGLGNTISNLSITDSGKRSRYVGLFAYVGGEGTLTNVRLTNISVNTVRERLLGGVGGLAGLSGTLAFDSVSGSVSMVAKSVGGGLVGTAYGTITGCSANASITAQDDSTVGGLVGRHWGGTIDSSYATGRVSAGGTSIAGGLVGDAEAESFGPKVTNSYATGAVSAGTNSRAGGFVGNTYEATVASSYSTGTAAASPYAGGFAGFVSESALSSVYWDTTTSGTHQAVGGGSGNNITGLTTHELQSRLPTGFDPKVWAENPNINNGLPYLIANPPPK